MIFLIFFLMPTLIQSRIMDDGRVDDSTLVRIDITFLTNA